MDTLCVLISCLLLLKTAAGRQWTLHGSSPVAVVGTDFVLTCRVPPEDAKPVVLTWKRTQDETLQNQIIVTSSCVADGQILWPEVTFTCNDKVFTLTIPGKDIDADNDNNVRWKCENAGGSGKSNVLTLIVLDPVTNIQINGTNPLVINEGGTISVLCETSPSRPAADILWYKDSDNITSEANTVVEKQLGDKYITRSYLILTGNRADNGKKIQCKAYNGPAVKVANNTVLDIWYPPPNLQTLSGYNSGIVLYVGDSTNLVCKQEGGRPFSILTLKCNGKTGINKSSSTGSFVELAFTVDRTYSGQTCSCLSTHVLNNYKKVVDVVLTVHYAPDSSPQITGYSNGSALNDGSTISITCTQRGGFPLSDITWDCMGHSSVATNKGGQQSTSSVSFTADRTYNQKMCTCTATHPDTKMNYARSKSVMFTVYYAPLSGNDPHLSGYVNGTALLESPTEVKQLTCRQGDCNPLCTLTWDCQGLTGTNHSTQKEAVSVIKVPMQRTYNGKTCKCTASHISIAYTDHTSVVFIIYYKPTLPSISVSPSFPWLEKTQASLQCDVTDRGNPPITDYIWLDGGKIIENQNKKTLTYNLLTNIDHGKNISCRVKNIASLPLNSVAETLNVEYLPIISVEQNNLTIIEGRIAERICSAVGNPMPIVKWMKGSTVLSGGSSGSATLQIHNIIRTATGVYTCYAEAKSAVEDRDNLMSSQSINLIVQYPPDVSVNIKLNNVAEHQTNIQLICKASGVPSVYNYLGWKQTIGRSTVRTTDQFTGLSQDKRVLQFANVTFHDAGIYYCDVSNNIKSPQTGRGYFNVQTNARFKSDKESYTFYSRLNRELVVTIPFYSNPAANITGIKWKNLSDDSIIIESENTAFSLVDSPFNTSIYSIDLSLNGQTARMIISSLKSFHEGNYSVSVSNGISTASLAHFWIFLSDLPETPTNFYFTVLTTNSMTVRWSKGFNGGHRQTFVVLVFKKKNPLLEQKLQKEENQDKNYTLTVDSLQPDTSYTLLLYAYNTEGRSSKNVTFLAATGKELVNPSPSQPAALIGGATAGCLVLISLLTGVLIFFIKRQKGEKADDTGVIKQRNVYECLGDHPQPSEDQYQKLRPSAIGKTTNAGTRNEYEDLGRTDKPNVYDKLEFNVKDNTRDAITRNVHADFSNRDMPKVYENIKQYTKAHLYENTCFNQDI